MGGIGVSHGVSRRVGLAPRRDRLTAAPLRLRRSSASRPARATVRSPARRCSSLPIAATHRATTEQLGVGERALPRHQVAGLRPPRQVSPRRTMRRRRPGADRRGRATAPPGPRPRGVDHRGRRRPAAAQPFRERRHRHPPSPVDDLQARQLDLPEPRSRVISCWWRRSATARSSTSASAGHRRREPQLLPGRRQLRLVHRVLPPPDGTVRRERGRARWVREMLRKPKRRGGVDSVPPGQTRPSPEAPIGGSKDASETEASRTRSTPARRVRRGRAPRPRPSPATSSPPPARRRGRSRRRCRSRSRCSR